LALAGACKKSIGEKEKKDKKKGVET